MGGCLTMQVQD